MAARVPYSLGLDDQIRKRLEQARQDEESLASTTRRILRVGLATVERERAPVPTPQTSTPSSAATR